MTALILFDFDGTLADTAPDLGAAANRQRTRAGLEPLPLEVLRPYSSAGARGLLRCALNLTPADEAYEALRLEWFDNYQAAMAVHSTLFEGGATVKYGNMLFSGGLNWKDGGAYESVFGGQVSVRLTW